MASPRREIYNGQTRRLDRAIRGRSLNKCNITPDMVLQTKVTIGCGPAIYNADASTVAGSQPSELETVKNNFLIKKLGLTDGPQLMEGIISVIEVYGRSERKKYRAVVYYMLTKHFGKEAVYS